MLARARPPHLARAWAKSSNKVLLHLGEKWLAEFEECRRLGREAEATVLAWCALRAKGHHRQPPRTPRLSLLHV